ncbi:hypothetical protein SAMN05421819_1725 [Bryocella elongata]|uniref:Uncharacterized protein n=1 Tax=Bryocella elongata TaxID=863522 RepID=A0A1H5WSN3_9BACT|nr:hypothetical protein [Bryocella elongata]SEG02441.1 hypothetical protein SAMN05421819_1725 [Bryocella elongata]
MTRKSIKIHKPAPTLHLPAHEQRAAARRRHNAALPNIPGPKPRIARAAKPRPIPAHKVTTPRSVH